MLTALRKLSQEDERNWVKHLPTALLMARSRVNRDIHFSPFKMVYGYKPEIQELPKRLKLVEPAGVPMDDDITPELKNIRDLAAEQGAKRARKQVVDQTKTFKINDEVWALNPDNAKLYSEIMVLIL